MAHTRKLILLILGVCIIIDMAVWFVTYQVATTPAVSAEIKERQQAAIITPTLAPSSVDPDLDKIKGASQTHSLNGLWRYRQTGSEIANDAAPDLTMREGSTWHTMQIPQNWFLAGLNYQGVIWFQRQFTADTTWRGRTVRLHFAGVDYVADVWLNGHKLGRHEGYFQPFTFPIHDHLNYSGQNVLVVRVESPYEEFETVWPDRKRLIKGVFGHHPTRPGGASSPAGQAYNTGGIWNDVYLTIDNAVTIEALQLGATWPAPIATNPTATLTAQIMLANHTDIPIDLTANLTLSPRNFAGPTISLPPQTVTLLRGETELALQGLAPNPRLWWPWDRGEPNLYTAHLTITTKDEKVIAARKAPFGFRQIQVGPKGDWVLNGQQFFPRGSHYISQQWLSQPDAAWFQRDLALLRQANLNFIRLQAHLEPAEFYQTADELGLLVWQDFPLYGGYSDAPAFVDQAQEQLIAMIEGLYNHPSLVAWNVHTASPWTFPEGKARQDSSNGSSQNKRLDERLIKLAQTLDPTRYVYQPTQTGNGEIYFGWTEGAWTDFQTLPKNPLITAYGAQALPDLIMMQQIFEQDAPAYDTQDNRARWRFHAFQPKATFNIAQIDPSQPDQSITDFITHSQAYQANLIQYATETYRRAKYAPIQGIFHFMFVDHWPAITQAVLDYDRQPKAGFYALQTAMQPILPSIEPTLPAYLEGRRWVYTSPDDLSIGLWVINDTLKTYPQAHLTWRIEQIKQIEQIEQIKQIEQDQGTLVSEDTLLINVQADQVHYAHTLDNLALRPGSYRLSLVLTDQQEKLLGANSFAFVIRPP